MGSDEVLLKLEFCEVVFDDAVDKEVVGEAELLLEDEEEEVLVELEAELVDEVVLLVVVVVDEELKIPAQPATPAGPPTIAPVVDEATTQFDLLDSKLPLIAVKQNSQFHTPLNSHPTPCSVMLPTVPAKLETLVASLMLRA